MRRHPAAHGRYRDAEPTDPRFPGRRENPPASCPGSGARGQGSPVLWRSLHFSFLESAPSRARKPSSSSLGIAAISAAAGKSAEATAARKPESALTLSSRTALYRHGEIAPGSRMARPLRSFAADVGGEEENHVRVGARSERDGDERGAPVDLGEHRGGDHLAFDGEGAGVFEAAKPVPQLYRFSSRLSHRSHRAEPGRFARHKAKVTDDGYRTRPPACAPFRGRAP